MRDKRWRLGLLLLAMSACTAPMPSDSIVLLPEVVETTMRYRKEYVLAPGDTLDVLIYKHPEASRDVVIRPDGRITIPYLEEVQAAGLTVRELDDVLTGLLSKRLKDPELAIIATGVRPPVVYVYGEVLNTQVVQLRDAATAAQAIIKAGGFNSSAAKDSVVILRLGDENRLLAMKIDLDVAGQPAPYMAAHNVLLQADDMIFVPQSRIGEFNQWVNLYLQQPLTGFNSLLGSYANLKLAQNIDDL